MLIAHVSDTHFGSEDRDAIAYATDAINLAKPDLLVVSGDLTQRGKRQEFAQAAAWLQAFDCCIITVPGNHDVPLLNVVNRIAGPFVRYEAALGQYGEPYSSKTANVAGLNTSRGWQMRKNWAEGSVNLKKLSDILDSNEAPRILTCHHPFLPIPSAPLKTQTVRGLAASKLIAASDVELLLTGHTHKPSAITHRHDDGSYLNITCGTLSTRTRNHSPSFNLIALSERLIEIRVVICDADNREVTEQQKWDRKSLELLPL